MWLQKEILLKPRTRGFHLITGELVHGLPELRDFNAGLLNVFMLHTSASLTINENADPSVRQDFERYFNHAVPEITPNFAGSRSADSSIKPWHHQEEGPDDMPAHLKSSLLGCSLNIPVTQGQLRLGTWQGIYLCEHRNSGGSRKLVVTVQGE